MRECQYVQDFDSTSAKVMAIERRTPSWGVIMRTATVLAAAAVLTQFAFAPVGNGAGTDGDRIDDPAGDANGLHQAGMDQATGPASYGQGDITGLSFAGAGDVVEIRLELAEVPDPSQQPPMVWYGVRATIDGCDWEFSVLSGSAAAEPDEAGMVGYVNDLDGCDGADYAAFGSHFPVRVDADSAAIVLEVPLGEPLGVQEFVARPGQSWTQLWARTAVGQYAFGGWVSSNGGSGGWEQELTVGLDRTSALDAWTVPS